VKLLEARVDALEFVLGRREMAFLLSALQNFPVTRPKPPALTLRDAPADASAQRLLEDSLAEHKRENVAALRKFLDAPGTLRAEGSTLHLVVPRDAVEWLLQVLNDLRVGSWELLGCPDPDVAIAHEDTVRHHLVMDTCAVFEMALIEALERPAS
jgi:hypothetical protein